MTHSENLPIIKSFHMKSAFEEAVRGKNRISIIADIKRRSPSHGTFPQHNVAELISEYQHGGAAAISVVTEEKRFSGSMELLKKVAEHTTLPVLRKDFITHINQIDETASAGASAILLIAHLLDKRRLAIFVQHAIKKNLTPLVEIHDEEDLKKIRGLRGVMIGINNRNLATLKTNVRHAESLIDYIDPDLTIVVESAFSKPEELALYKGKADAALIGTALLTAKNPAETLRSFISSTKFMQRRIMQYGGMFVSELLVPPLLEIADAFENFKKDRHMQARLTELLKTFVGRPTPLYFAKNLSAQFGYRLFLKREDLVHGGAHKTNNTVGQGLLAEYMGKKELIAETGAGQHGVAVALVGGLLNMPVKVFMGVRDIERQQMNVLRMKLFGAEVVPVKNGSQTLKDAINEAMRYYVAHSKNTYYIFGTAAGPRPFPSIVRHFQSVIGKETRLQIKKQTWRLPDYVIACVGGGSNAIGIFSAFLKDKQVKLIGAEPAGGAALGKGKLGILHGSRSYVLQDKSGQILESRTIAAGLDYPGVGPEHSFLKDTGRVQYLPISDKEALVALKLLAQKEGIIPALESAHALAYAAKLSGRLRKDEILIVNISGRGDKDLQTVFETLKKH